MSARDDSAPPRIAPHPLVVAIDGPEGTVLLDVGAGRRLTLDAFGTRVWAHLADAPTLDVLRDRLRDDHATPRELDALPALLAHWRELHLID